MNSKHPSFGTDGDGPLVDDAQVRDLLKSAGPRPELPEGDLKAIRAAARTEWKDLVSRQQHPAEKSSRLRPLALAASVVLVIAFVAWWMSTTMRDLPVAGEVFATIELSEGQTEQGLAVGDEVLVGAELVTPRSSDDTSIRLTLRLASGSSLRIDRGSTVVVNSPDQVELVRGAVYLDTGSDAAESYPTFIKTAFGTVHHVGTQYETRILDSGDSLRIRVREGRVSLESESATHDIDSGKQLRVGLDGDAIPSQIPPYGPEWDWIEASAPGIDTAGMSLHVYLEWVARETGRSIVFETRALEARASEIELGTQTYGMNPLQSLAAMLPASHLKFELQNGSILIYGDE